MYRKRLQKTFQVFSQNFLIKNVNVLSYLAHLERFYNFNVIDNSNFSIELKLVVI